MKTASVRDLRQNFPRIMAWIADGEEVAVTMRRKVVARLIPERPPARNKIPTPDFAAIGKKIFGDQAWRSDAMEAEREGYEF